jgi:hypothetical protein
MDQVGAVKIQFIKEIPIPAPPPMDVTVEQLVNFFGGAIQGANVRIFVPIRSDAGNDEFLPFRIGLLSSPPAVLLKTHHSDFQPAVGPIIRTTFDKGDALVKVKILEMHALNTFHLPVRTKAREMSVHTLILPANFNTTTRENYIIPVVTKAKINGVGTPREIYSFPQFNIDMIANSL